MTSVSSSMPRCFEVGDQRRGGAVAVGAELAVPRVVVGVRVPGLVVAAGVVDGDEPHAVLDQPAGEQARAGEGRVAVHLADVTRGSWLMSNVSIASRLHPEGRLHRPDLRLQLGVPVALRRGGAG